MPAHSKNAKPSAHIAVIGIDIGKNVFHLIGLDQCGSIVMKAKLSRGQLENCLANIPHCLIGMEACVGSHHLSRRLITLGHDARLMPAKYVKPFLKGHKNDYRDAEACAEAVQRPTMRFVAAKTQEQLDLQALHRVRARLVAERTATVNEIRAFLLERGITVAKGIQRLRMALPDILDWVVAGSLKRLVLMPALRALRSAALYSSSRITRSAMRASPSSNSIIKSPSGEIRDENASCSPA